MARFSVYPNPEGPGLLLDCQADLLDMLATRFVVPLMAEEAVPPPIPRLMPILVVEDRRYVMVTPHAATVPARLLTAPVAHLADEAPAILNALDMLLTGY